MSNQYCEVCNTLKSPPTKIYAPYFVCSNSAKDWHKQAEAIFKEMKRCPSLKLSEIMQSEIKELIHSQKATKTI